MKRLELPLFGLGDRRFRQRWDDPSTPLFSDESVHQKDGNHSHGPTRPIIVPTPINRKSEDMTSAMISTVTELIKKDASPDKLADVAPAPLYLTSDRIDPAI